MRDYALFRRVFGPATRILNSYGVTEATIDSTLDDVGGGEEGRSAPSIGRPLPNTAAYVLDRTLEPLPAGVRGELFLGGPGVARGYVGRPDLTAERFLPDPHGEPGARVYRTGDAARRLIDGRIEFGGRTDAQVKIRGQRIEPAEIEAVLRTHPDVRTCAVIARDHEAGPRLVAYVVLDTPRADAAAMLRAHLAGRLPDPMIPSAVVVLESLPLSANGKIDRRSLPEPAWSASAARVEEAPATGTQRALVEAWKRVLGVDGVGTSDNFFELGGDSILSIQVVSRARAAGVRITPRMIFEHPTIGRLARAADHLRTTGPATPARTGERPLSPIQRWFFAQEFVDASHWNMAIALDSREPLEIDAARRAAGALIDHHDSLRSRFVRDGASWRQVIGTSRSPRWRPPRASGARTPSRGAGASSTAVSTSSAAPSSGSGSWQTPRSAPTRS